MTPLLLGWLWALPYSLIGAITALLSLSRPYAFRQGTVLCVAGTWMGAWMRNRFSAHTQGVVIFTTSPLDLADEVDAHLWRHEYAHVRQAFVFGALMPILYLGASLFLWVTGKRAYWDNPFEVHARKVAGR